MCVTYDMIHDMCKSIPIKLELARMSPREIIVSNLDFYDLKSLLDFIYLLHEIAGGGRC